MFFVLILFLVNGKDLQQICRARHLLLDSMDSNDTIARGHQTHLLRDVQRTFYKQNKFWTQNQT